MHPINLINPHIKHTCSHIHTPLSNVVYVDGAGAPDGAGKGQPSAGVQDRPHYGHQGRPGQLEHLSN